MAKRFSDDHKWQEAWYRGLSPLSKNLYGFIWDNCDWAGFWEIDMPLAGLYIGCNEELLDEALKGLQNVLIVRDGFCWLLNFIEEQGNLPLRPDRKPAHRGIIKRLLKHPEFRDVWDRLFSEKKELLWDTDGIGIPSSISISKGISISQGGVGGKTKLLPIPGKTCCKCPMPAVYKDCNTSGYVHLYCPEHMPELVKAQYR